MKNVDVARKYIGQREKQGNVFDENTVLGKMLHKAGQRNGESWCAYFAEAVCVEAYPEKHKELTDLFSASAVRTFENFKREGFTISEKPELGAIVVWKRWKEGQPTWQGHVGIVSEVGKDYFKSIEGNTNALGSREGDSVQEKTRKVMTTLETGLNVLGFIVLGYE